MWDIEQLTSFSHLTTRTEYEVATESLTMSKSWSTQPPCICIFYITECNYNWGFCMRRNYLVFYNMPQLRIWYWVEYFTLETIFYSQYIHNIKQYLKLGFWGNKLERLLKFAKATENYCLVTEQRTGQTSVYTLFKYRSWSHRFIHHRKDNSAFSLYAYIFYIVVPGWAWKAFQKSGSSFAKISNNTYCHFMNSRR